MAKKNNSNSGEDVFAGDLPTEDEMENLAQEEQAQREEATAEFDAEGADDIRQLVYETADRSAGVGPVVLSNEGAPLTQFEQESVRFFERQNEVEREIDQAEVSDDARMMFAGTDVNVLQTSESLVGSATVTNYVGETIHPYPPTDYNAAAILAGDLTTDPVLAELGLVAGNPMPPENNVHDLRETDGRDDTKDYSRRLRVPNDLIVESRRAKYPAGVEAPV